MKSGLKTNENGSPSGGFNVGAATSGPRETWKRCAYPASKAAIR